MDKKTVGTVSVSELEALKKKAEMYEQNAETIKQAKELRAKIEELEAELEGARKAEHQRKIKEYRDGLNSFINAEADRMNKEKFGGNIPDLAVAEAVDSVRTSLDDQFIEQCMADTVDGEDNAKRRVKEKLFSVLEAKAKVFEEFQANIAKQMMNNGVNINTLDIDRRRLGSYGEKAYGSDSRRMESNDDIRWQLAMFVVSEALGKPMVRSNGGTWLDEFRPRLQKVIEAQRKYEEAFGTSESHMFSRGGKLFGLLNSEQAREKIFNMFKAEAGEMTTTNTVGGKGIDYLALDASAAVIMATWPQLIALQVAAGSGNMNSTTKRLQEIGYPRTDGPFRQNKHWFGAVDSASSTTLDTSKTLADSTVVADDGALSRSSGHLPQKVYAYLGEAVDADVTITITGTNQNGDTDATATVVFETTDPVGTVKQFNPTFPGDLFLDVTGVSASGWTASAGNGEVGIFTEEPYSGHVPGSPAQKARFTLNSVDVSESSFDIQSNLTLEVIEDMQMALNDGTGIDVIARMINFLTADLRDMIDRRLLDAGNQGVFSLNSLVFNANSPDSELYSDAAWKERLHFNIDNLITQVKVNSGQRPNWIIWSEYDRPHFVEWLTQSGALHRLSPEANDPFADARAQFSIGGASVYVTENQPVENVLLGNNRQSGLHAYTYVPFKLLQATNPTAGMEQVVMLHHRGYYGVPKSDKVDGGRALGKLKVNRR